MSALFKIENRMPSQKGSIEIFKPGKSGIKAIDHSNYCDLLNWDHCDLVTF